jgi:hypothetical protein
MWYFNKFCNELQINYAYVFLNVFLGVLCVFPEDGVMLHRNMLGVYRVCYTELQYGVQVGDNTCVIISMYMVWIILKVLSLLSQACAPPPPLPPTRRNASKLDQNDESACSSGISCTNFIQSVINESVSKI